MPMNPNFASYPFLQALRERRSRRFCRGMTLPAGPLAFQSRQTPIPLTDTEEALLAYAACGITGCALADLEYSEKGGGSIMAGLIGRTIASGDGIQTTSLITISDSGAHLYRRPQELPPATVRELLTLAESGDFTQAAAKMRVRIHDQRVRIPAEPIFNINANRWSLHAPGTTIFLPVNELSFMYINGLLEILNEHTGAYILDERAGFRPAGLAPFAKSKGGHLHDHPAAGRVATVALVERLVTEFCTVEQGMVHQNLALMAQTLGLGGFPNFANHDFAWFEALGFRMQRLPTSQYLGIRGLPALAMKLLGRDPELPIPIGLARGSENLLTTCAPPYFPTMRAAVEAVAARKFGPHGLFRDPAALHPWKPVSGDAVPRQVPPTSEKAIAATTAYCEYLWHRYGRFPVHMPPLRTVLAFQAGHLDLEFYDRHYPASALSPTHRADHDSLAR